MLEMDILLYNETLCKYEFQFQNLSASVRIQTKHYFKVDKSIAAYEFGNNARAARIDAPDDERRKWNLHLRRVHIACEMTS